jgi:hypothetical protein
MELVIDSGIKAFNAAAVRRGDVIRVRRAGDTVYRNGFVTNVSPGMIEILYCNIQNSQTSFLRITAEDAAAGEWEVYWTADFKEIKSSLARDNSDG